MSDASGFDVNALLGQAMEMQQQLLAAQAEAATMRFTGSSGNGAVQIDVSGSGEFLAVRLDPSVVDASDVAMLEDLVLAAMRDASTRASEASAQMMSAFGGGALGGLLGNARRA